MADSGTGLPALKGHMGRAIPTIAGCLYQEHALHLGTAPILLSSCSTVTGGPCTSSQALKDLPSSSSPDQHPWAQSWRQEVIREPDPSYIFSAGSQVQDSLPRPGQSLLQA